MFRSFIHNTARKFLIACTLMTGINAVAMAADLHVQLTDKNGNPLSDAVVFATPLKGGLPPPDANARTTIGQRDMQFSPYVTAIRAGTQIEFPNFDKMEHHVKSFSAAKEFEIKTYEKGVTPPPVTFDKTGVVIVYCLLHNWMRAYVLVLDTPYFSKSETDGSVLLKLPADGEYKIEAWHPQLGAIKPALQQTTQVSGKNGFLKFQFDFVPVPRKNKQS
ncbi:methylamine utilization protein [Undibacterium luofuense]|uniref:methylamine utilization protein n=1 Tax=Undibacterium luofuense TaxID=2828733 RepID=UPI0030EC318C